MSAPSSSYLSASVWLPVLPRLCVLPRAPTPGPPVFGGKSTIYLLALPRLAPFLVPVIPLLSFPVIVVSQLELEYSNTSCHLGTFSPQVQSSLSLPVMRIFKYNNNSSSKECPALLLKLPRCSSTLFPSITPLMCTARTRNHLSFLSMLSFVCWTPLTPATGCPFYMAFLVSQQWLWFCPHFNSYSSPACDLWGLSPSFFCQRFSGAGNPSHFCIPYRALWVDVWPAHISGAQLDRD